MMIMIVMIMITTRIRAMMGVITVPVMVIILTLSLCRPQLRMPGCRACAEKTGGVSWSQGQGAVQCWQPGEQEGDTARWCSAVMGGWVQCSAVVCWALVVVLVVVVGVEGHTVEGRQCNHRHPRDEEVSWLG